MDWSGITQLITNAGFPIAACVGLAIFLYKYIQQSNATIKELTDAINKLTTMVTIINDKLK